MDKTFSGLRRVERFEHNDEERQLGEKELNNEEI